MKATTFLYKFYTLQFHVFFRAKGFSVNIKVSGINSRHLQIFTVTFSFPVFTSYLAILVSPLM